MAIIEGTGIKTAGKEAQKKAKNVAKVYYGGPEAEKRRQLNKDLDKFMKDFGGSPASDKFNPRGRGMGDRFDPTAKAPTNFFSPGGGAFDKRNNVKVASSDLSNLQVSGSSDDEGGSDTSTFGASFTGQAGANLADSSIYKKKEDNIYRDTTDVYSDFKNIYKSPKTEEDTVKSVEKFYGLDPRGVKYVPRNESKYGETPVSGAFPGQEDKVITTREKITGVRDFGYMPGDKVYGTYDKQQGGLGIGAALDQNKTGLVPRPGGLGGLYSKDDVTQSYVKAMMQNKADVLSAEERNRRDKIRNPQNYNADGSLKTLDQKYSGFLSERDKMETEFANRAGYDSYADYQKSREEFNNKISNKFAEKPTPVESEKKDPTVLQKVGNFIGGITNAALGIQPARGGELTNELTGVDKALSGATKKFHLGSSGHTIDDVYMPSMAEKYKRPKTGIEKGLDQLGNFIGRITRPPGAEGAEMPSTVNNQTGDTSFSAYVAGGGEGQERGKTTGWQSRTDFLKKNPNTSMETYLSSLPYGPTDFMKPDPDFPKAKNVDTAAYERYFMTGNTAGLSREKGTGSQPDGTGSLANAADISKSKGSLSNVADASKKKVAGLPSNYKATEAEAFRKAAAFKEAQGIAKRNPNVSVGVDSKGQPTATATNDSGVAKAQAAAVNRKLAGKSISQVKADNKAAMRKSAAERHAEFKKTGKSTVSARRAAAKKSMQAAAKKRHAAFKKKRAAKAAAKKAKAKAKAAARARNKKSISRSRRGGRGRRGRRGRR